MQSTNSQDHQAGSLVSYILIAVALLALTIGGVYLAKQRAISDTNNGEQTAQNNDSADDSGRTNTEQTPAPDDSEAETAPGTDRSNGGTQAPDQSSGSPAAPAPSTPAPVTPQPQTAIPEQAPRTGGQATESSAAIPATGPEDQLLVGSFAIIALTYGTIRYIQSRRNLYRL